MKERRQIVTEFNAYSFHDDTVHAIRIIPSTDRRHQNHVEIDLVDYYTDKPYMVRFSGCSCISFNGDLGVLKNQAFANTSWAEAIDDNELITRTMKQQMIHLNIEYDPESIHPTNRELEQVANLVLFRIAFFGGTLEVVARRFHISKTKKPTGPHKPSKAGDKSTTVIVHQL